MRDVSRLVAVAVNGMTERLHDPKNVAKGDFPTDFKEIFDGIKEEYLEVMDDWENTRFETLRSELSDLIVCCAFGLLKLEGSDV